MQTAWLKSERFLISAALLLLTAVSWLYLVRGASAPKVDQMHGTTMAISQPWHWGGPEIIALTVMWGIMMAAMMLPSAAPMLLLFSRVNGEKARRGDAAVISTGIFLSGYLLVWSAFSLLAAGAQWALHNSMLLSVEMSLTSPLLQAPVVIAAGLYQFTPLKNRCLIWCRSPLEFLFTHWREGRDGALRMGLRHGLYCLGCCWALMALLFVGGVMSLFWIALLTGLVLLEKVWVRGILLGKFSGAALVSWGLFLLIRLYWPT